VYDFQALPDRSIDPPPEPLPVRWGLDLLWSANKYTLAPSDGARLQSYMKPPSTPASTASFVNYQRSLNQNQDRATLTYVNPANYDGTFIPSNSVRTVEPPDANDQLENLKTDSGWVPPWTVIKGV
jgi:hypothetical protein